MAFPDDLDKIIPAYLVDGGKNRLKEALEQFAPEHRGKVINYESFYKDYGHAYFMQADLIKEIRMSIWKEADAIFDKGYTDAIIISNTCDISAENEHKANSKQCLFAPIVDFALYVENLQKDGYSGEKLDQFIGTVRAQMVSNLFYLPSAHGVNNEYVVMLDRIFWFPVNELNSYIDEINKNRMASLSHFGYYLFIMKLSYHLCRLPEQCDRELAI
jgi:hypothetical protein